MKLFSIISASLLFLQDSVSANEGELAREIASELLLTAPFDSSLIDSAFSPILSIDHDSDTLGSIDSDFSRASTIANTAIAIIALEAAQKLKAALRRVNIFKEVTLEVFEAGFDLSVYDAANEHTEVKQALKELVLAREAQELNRALTPTEKRYELSELELHLALLKAKLLDEPITEEVLYRHPEVAEAHVKYVEAKEQLHAERAAAAAR